MKDKRMVLFFFGEWWHLLPTGGGALASNGCWRSLPTGVGVRFRRVLAFETAECLPYFCRALALALAFASVGCWRLLPTPKIKIMSRFWCYKIK